MLKRLVPPRNKAEPFSLKKPPFSQAIADHEDPPVHSMPYSSDHATCRTRHIADTWLPLNVQPPSAWLTDPYYNNTAITLLAPNFQLYSDSDNYVGSPPPNNPVRFNFRMDIQILMRSIQPPGTVTAASRADWIDQQVENESNPDIVNITVTVLNLVHDCNQIATRWRYEGYYEWPGPEDGLSDVSGDMIGTTGFDYLIVEGRPPQIVTVYREFNDLEFSYELGQYICFQRNNQTRCT
ncbi:25S rRNA (adenine2142-N1)-methyltransferase [Zalaria obscura]|uniref:25S rRNA (Adenine2142-N1)-methyltransferase n=1 Tax=Zalaria obscura TaxID=2024903 RepID=A0ACC3SAJ6_9PEZI